MDNWEQELKNHLGQLPKLTSPSLEIKIHAKIKQETTRKQFHKRFQLMGSLAAVGACLVLFSIWSVPNWIGLSSSSSGTGPIFFKSGTNFSGANHASTKSPLSSARPALQVIGKPLVTWIGENPDKPVSNTNPTSTVRVTAQLKNSSNDQILSNQNTQGLLLFFKDGVQVASYFVDAPNTPVKPGDLCNWSYSPAPDSWPGRISDAQVQLTFVNRTDWQPLVEQVTDSDLKLKADIVGNGWKISPTPLEFTSPSLTGYGPERMYMQLSGVIYNPSNVPLNDNQLMALVFLPKNPADPVLDPAAYKYMVDVHFKGGTIAPKTHQTVSFSFIGSAGIDLTERKARVLIVTKAKAAE